MPRTARRSRCPRLLSGQWRFGWSFPHEPLLHLCNRVYPRSTVTQLASRAADRLTIPWKRIWMRGFSYSLGRMLRVRLLDAVPMVPPALSRHLGPQFAIAAPDLAPLRATGMHRR